MKYLLIIPIVILAFAAFIVLIMLLYTLIGWLKGAENILMPGLGLVISATFLLLVLLAAEIILASVLGLFVRFFLKY